jgi:hypothetical protein
MSQQVSENRRNLKQFQNWNMKASKNKHTIGIDRIQSRQDRKDIN